jgi:hypothetical protein
VAPKGHLPERPGGGVEQKRGASLAMSCDGLIHSSAAHPDLVVFGPKGELYQGRRREPLARQ